MLSKSAMVSSASTICSALTCLPCIPSEDRPILCVRGALVHFSPGSASDGWLLFHPVPRPYKYRQRLSHYQAQALEAFQWLQGINPHYSKKYMHFSGLQAQVMLRNNSAVAQCNIYILIDSSTVPEHLALAIGGSALCFF
jgi:hypothetical protein